MDNQRLSKCVYCKESVTKFMRQRLHNQYFETFNFYFSKPITEILANVPVDHVILFKDFLFYNDDNEYLKRYYQRSEIPQRINILADYYAPVQLKPNLLKTTTYKIMQKRISKIQKLNKPQKQNTPINQRMLPERMFSEGYEDQCFSESNMINQISWDSKSHNIYEQSRQTTQRYDNEPTQRDKALHIQLDQTGDHNKLFCCQQDQDIEKEFNSINQLTSRILVQKEPKAVVPPLKLDQKSQSSIQNLMKKYDHILQKRFQAKEILTERNEPRSKKITDEMLIRIYKQHIENMKKQRKPSENYQFHASFKSNPQQIQQQSCTFEKENDKKKKFQNKVYLPKPYIRKPPSQMSSPSTTNLQNTCSPSMLLRSLSNPSMAPSPARKLEIKVNLNKLIQRQEEEVGYWTQRKYQQNSYYSFLQLFSVSIEPQLFFPFIFYNQFIFNDMSINYAQLRRHRRSTVDQVRQPKNYKMQQPMQLELDEQQTNKNLPFTFENRQIETKKRFVFEEQKPDFQHIIEAMDDYIDHLNDSQDQLQPQGCSKIEFILFQKLNLIKQKHEDVLRQYKDSQNICRQLKQQNNTLKSQLIEQSDKHQKLELSHQKLKIKYQELQLKTQQVKLKQKSFSNSEIQSDKTYDDSFDDEQMVAKFLRQQMRKLKQNNIQIERYSMKNSFDEY
ncbi:hypothetical protein pb186bvf_014581 [Paramecium bursaria]